LQSDPYTLSLRTPAQAAQAAGRASDSAGGWPAGSIFTWAAGDPYGIERILAKDYNTAGFGAITGAGTPRNLQLGFKLVRWRGFRS
jgi:hypothetical protein